MNDYILFLAQSSDIVERFVDSGCSSLACARRSSGAVGGFIVKNNQDVKNKKIILRERFVNNILKARYKAINIEGTKMNMYTLSIDVQGRF